MHELGYNYRITDFQCALGLSQLKKLDGFVKRRAEIVAAYNAAFSSLQHVQTPVVASFRPPHFAKASQGKPLSDLGPPCSDTPIPPYPHTPPPPTAAAWHLYVLQLEFAALGKTRTQAMSELKSKGIGTQVHYIPVHLQPYYRRKYNYGGGKCPAAEAYYQRCLSLPLYPAMDDGDVGRVIEAVSAIIR